MAEQNHLTPLDPAQATGQNQWYQGGGPNWNEQQVYQHDQSNTWAPLEQQYPGYYDEQGQFHYYTPQQRVQMAAWQAHHAQQAQQTPIQPPAAAPPEKPNNKVAFKVQQGKKKQNGKATPNNDPFASIPFPRKEKPATTTTFVDPMRLAEQEADQHPREEDMAIDDASFTEPRPLTPQKPQPPSQPGLWNYYPHGVSQPPGLPHEQAHGHHAQGGYGQGYAPGYPGQYPPNNQQTMTPQQQEYYTWYWGQQHLQQNPQSPPKNQQQGGFGQHTYAQALQGGGATRQESLAQNFYLTQQQNKNKGAKQQQPKKQQQKPPQMANQKKAQPKWEPKNEPVSAMAQQHPGLFRFMQRAFFHCTTQEDKAEMHLLLKPILEKAKANNEFEKIDWDKEPLPKREPIDYGNADWYMDKAGVKKKKIPEPSEKQRRERRFSSISSSFVKGKIQNEEWDDMVVVGTCQVLEKSYLRLTSNPDPSLVRPERVLMDAVEMVKNRWKRERDWEWTSDQFKSIRQDMTVQNIKNEFTIKVYEAHARLCLENSVIGEFNTCQAQLKMLYALGLPGQVVEFTAYRILYTLFENNAMSVTQLLQDLDLSPALHNDAAIKHALEARRAFATKNFVEFFRLSDKAPNMGRYIMEFVFERLRLETMHQWTRAYRPTLSVAYVKEALRFKSDAECRSWFLEHYVTYMPGDKTEIDCKAATLGLIRFDKEYEEKTRVKTSDSDK